MKLPIFQVDTFADGLFAGNPAAVVILDSWPDDDLMQHIAAENNLAETAFLVNDGNEYEIRWFTPSVEVDLCGHATLASGFILFNFYDIQENKIVFKSKNSGELSVIRQNNKYELDFPLDEVNQIGGPILADLLLGMGTEPKELYKGKTDYLMVFESQEEVESLNPDFNYLRKAGGRGVIVTAPGDKVDFVSRFFAPQVGIDEDPVTGSAHTTLISYWSNRLNKNEFVARQLSKRGGTLYCKLENGRAKIAGNAFLYMKGEIVV